MRGSDIGIIIERIFYCFIERLVGEFSLEWNSILFPAL